MTAINCVAYSNGSGFVYTPTFLTGDEDGNNFLAGGLFFNCLSYGNNTSKS